jgi:hypothetical protein
VTGVEYCTAVFDLSVRLYRESGQEEAPLPTKGKPMASQPLIRRKKVFYINYGVCILLYVLMLDSLFDHNFLKFTYVIIKKYV